MRSDISNDFNYIGNAYESKSINGYVWAQNHELQHTTLFRCNRNRNCNYCNCSDDEISPTKRGEDDVHCCMNGGIDIISKTIKRKVKIDILRLRMRRRNAMMSFMIFSLIKVY